MSSPASSLMNKGLYHNADTRYNLCNPPKGLDSQVREKIEQQARSVACLVNKGQLLEINQKYTVSNVSTLKTQVEKSFKQRFKDLKTASLNSNQSIKAPLEKSPL